LPERISAIMLNNNNISHHTLPYLSLNRKLAIKLSLCVNLLIFFIVTTGHLFSEVHGKSIYMEDVGVLYFFIARFVTGFFIFYILYEFCFWVFRKKWKSGKKYFAAFFGTVAVASLISPIFSKAILLFFHSLPEDLFNRVVLIGFRKDSASAIVVFLSTFFISLFVRNQHTLLENQRLLAENIRNRHEALKNQMNPHFLFNSLNTLDGLIGYDDEKAHSYLHSLSHIFRYTIQNKEITTLKEELIFVKSYAFLMKIRYGESLRIQYKIDEKYNQFNITPLSLQLLIENAIKHNVVNARHPLTISIETTENNTIVVINAIKPKINVEAGEGIGLANLVERYKLLFGLDVLINKNEDFVVEIPLIAV